MMIVVKALNKRAGREIKVYGVDQVPERLQLARALGADDVFSVPDDEQGLRRLLEPSTQGRGADALLIIVPGARLLLQAIASVRKGGMVHIFAAHMGIVPMSIEKIYQQELSIISTYSSSPTDLHIALDLLDRHEVRVERLIDQRLPLEQFQKGVKLMRERKALKVYFQIAGETYGKYSL